LLINLHNDCLLQRLLRSFNDVAVIDAYISPLRGLGGLLEEEPAHPKLQRRILLRVTVHRVIPLAE
jgi:hypothetical protein